MKKRMAVSAAMAILIAGTVFSGCTAPWNRRKEVNEEVTPPQTSTVQRAEQAKPSEPEADPLYERYASVRIDAVAGVRLFVDTRKAEPVVVMAQALDKKGEAALAGWEQEDMAYAEVVSELSERLIRTGTVNAFHTHVTVALEQTGPSVEAAGRLDEKAREIFAKVYGEHGLEASFGNESTSVGE